MGRSGPQEQAGLLQTGREDCHRPEPVPAASLLDEVADAFRSAADDKRLRLEVAALCTTRAVGADRERIPLVLSNRVSNAIRHTPEGGSITLRAVDRGPSPITRRLPNDLNIRMLVQRGRKTVPKNHVIVGESRSTSFRSTCSRPTGVCSRSRLAALRKSPGLLRLSATVSRSAWRLGVPKRQPFAMFPS